MLRPLLAAAVALVALAGCGTSTGLVTDTGTGTHTRPSPSATPAIGHPTGHDDVVLRLKVGGGFVPVEWAFSDPAELVVTGDGTVYVPATPHQALDRMLRPIRVGHLGEDRVQALLHHARDLGLLRTPPDYESRDGVQVADAPTTTVRIDAGGGSWRHSAYALAMMTNQETGARGRLQQFVTDLRDLARGVATEPYRPVAVRIMAQRAMPGLPGGGSAKSLPWPADAGVALADVHRCTVVTSPSAVDAIAGARAFTRFVDHGVAYQVSAAVVLPGDDSC